MVHATHIDRSMIVHKSFIKMMTVFYHEPTQTHRQRYKDAYCT